LTGVAGKKIAPATSNGAKEFICCQGEQGSKGEKGYFAGVSAPSAYAGFGRVRLLEQLLYLSDQFERELS
jgi:hypothetical protein